MGDTHRQPAASGHTEKQQKAVELLGLATMSRIMLRYYVNCYTFLENHEKDWALLLENAEESPPELTLFD